MSNHGEHIEIKILSDMDLPVHGTNFLNLQFWPRYLSVLSMRLCNVGRLVLGCVSTGSIPPNTRPQ